MLKEAGISSDLQKAVGQNLAEVLSGYGIAFDPTIPALISKRKRPVGEIASVLSSIDLANVKALIYALRAEEIENAGQKLKEIYTTEFAPYGITEAEFSRLLQSSTGKPSADYYDNELKSIIDKFDSRNLDGLDIVKKFQTRFANSIFSTFRKVKDEEHLKSLFIGRLSPKLREELLKYGRMDEIEKIIDDNFAQLTKSELLDAAGFSEMQYPLSPRRYWPDLNDPKNTKLINDKFIETIDLDYPEIVAEAIVSEDKQSAVVGVEQQRIKFLYSNRFNKNKNLFYDFIKKTYLDMGYGEQILDEFIEDVDKFVSDEKGQDPRKKDNLFANTESYFRSIQERQIVDLIRDTFQLQCVASNIRFPKTEDFSLIKKNFIIDFIIYCDIFKGIEDLQGYQRPVIEKQVILIGEYYGYDHTTFAYDAPVDLYDPEGNLVYPKGTPLTKGQVYKFKTPYKEITESFCARALDCKSISLYEAETPGAQKKEIARGLQASNVIYSSDDRKVPPSNALEDLINWYKNADETSRIKSEAEVSRYFDTKTFVKKPGQEFKENKYSVKIIAAKKYIQSNELAIAISQTKKDYTITNIKSGDQSRSYLSRIRVLTKVIRENNKWRYDFLDALEKEIINSKYPINDAVFLRIIDSIQDMNKSEGSIKSPTNLFKMAFNYKSFIKL